MVLSYLTQDAVYQVSDRRLVMQNDGSVKDDDANKATIFCGHLAIGYTGLATIKTQSTDEWLANVLTKAKDVNEALTLIQDSATNWFQHNAYTPQQKRHAFIAAGWLHDREALRPIAVLLSNYHDKNRDRDEAAREFGRYQKLPTSEELPILVWIGQSFTESEKGDLQVQLGGAQDPGEILLTLCLAIRNISDRNSTVGRGIIAVHIPRTAVDAHAASPIVLCSGSRNFADDAINSRYLPANSQSLVVRAPNLVCPGIGLIRGLARPL